MVGYSLEEVLSKKTRTRKVTGVRTWGQVYATGSTGTIIGIGADIIIMDDPMKPDDANSELMITMLSITTKIQSRVD